ncbi:hypothetical protein D9M68_944480 [compost metagenome]
MSAPSCSGCCRYGDAKVLSTTIFALPSWATSARSSMSPILSSGFVGVSTQTSLVLDFIAARTASTSDTGAGVYSIPHCVNTLSMRRKVPPYASSGMTR